MNQHNAVARPGKLSIPEHMRVNTQFFQHGDKLQILEENVGGDPSRVRVLIGGRELNLDRRFIE